MDFFSTTVSPKAIELVTEILKSTRVSAGKMADEFEQKLMEKFDLTNITTVNSGTSALHLIIKMLNLKKGDEVILPAQTFISTGLAVLYEGGTPVFADINLDGNISERSIREKITDRTKAIICVDWAGYCCDYKEIRQLARRNNLITIADCAHSFGATYHTKPTGKLANYTAFSFQAIKHLTTGDGGAIVCPNLFARNEIRKLRWFYIDRDNDKPSVLGEREYDAFKIGYKYHMNDIAASMGIGNLEIIDEKLRRLRRIAYRYFTELENTDVELMNYKNDRGSSFWLFPLLVRKRNDFIRKLKDNGIPTSVVHLGIDKNSIFGGKREDLINQRYWDEHQIHIPINDSLTDEDVTKVIETIKSGW